MTRGEQIPDGQAAKGTGAAGRPGFGPAQFQQEVASEIGVDLSTLATKQAHYRQLERGTHSSAQRGRS